MARTLRLEYEGAIYHVMARGDQRRPIFRDDDDCHCFLEKLEETIHFYHLVLHAYVLMGNHYHLLLCTPRANLSQAMQQFQSSYSTYYRCRYRLSGHVYGGRYKAPLVEGDRYLLSLARYIHLNPARIRGLKNAPLTKRRSVLREYPWSSYRGYVGKVKRSGWVTYKPLLDLAGGSGAQVRRFTEFALVESDEELQEAMRRSSKAIGDEGFCQRVEDQYAELSTKQGAQVDVAMRRREVAKDPVAVLHAVCGYFGFEEPDFLGKRGNGMERDVLMVAWKLLAGLSNREIGHRLGHADGATVGKRLNAVVSDEDLRRHVDRIVASQGIANCKA